MSDIAGAAAPTEITTARVLGRVGRGFFHFLGHCGRLTLFLGSTPSRLFYRRFHGRELIAQLSFVGAGSVGVVTLSAIFSFRAIADRSGPDDGECGSAPAWVIKEEGR